MNLSRLFPAFFWAPVFLVSFHASGRAQEGSSAPVRDLSTVIAECEKSVVRIEVQTTANGPADEGLGSGFVIDSSGLIATNHHVLKDATAAKAIFEDGRSVPIQGTLLIDAGRDICIAKIDATDLPTLTFAKGLPRKGEKVVALGCPIGLSFTATVGVVSAIRSEKEMQKDLRQADLRGTWIQVDAALSPGNSGGPLINEAGEVVAMSTLASTFIAQNLNFGISADEIRKVAANAKNQTLAQFNPARSRGGGRSIAGRPASPPRGAVPGPPRSRLVPGNREQGERRIESFSEFGVFSELNSNAPNAPFTNKRPTPPDNQSAIKTFVTTGRRLYSVLYQDLLSNIRSCELDLESYQIEAEKRNLQKEKRSDFQTEQQKEKLASATSELIRLEAIRDALTPQMTNESLLKMLQTLGPPIDLKSKDSVGVLGKCRVLGVMSDEALFVAADDFKWCLLWVDSTKDYRAGQSMNVGPVVLTGFEAAVLPRGARSSETEFAVLISVDGEKLKELILGDAIAPAKALREEFRVWTDLTGKFSVEAVLVDVEGDVVHLRRRDGTPVNVPMSKLSDDDRKLLQK